VALWPASLPRPLDVTVDLRVVAFAVAAAVIAGLVAALSPGLVHLSAQSLRERGGAGARRRVRCFLVAGEVALTCVLLVASGLMIRSLERLLSVDPGFVATDVMTLEVSLPASAYGSEARQRAFFDDLLARLDRVPGVRATGAAINLPMEGSMNGDFEIEGRPPFPPAAPPSTEKHIVTPGYFATLRIPLLEGRLFDARDREGSRPAAIVNEAMARRYWPHGDAVGARLQVWGPGWLEIVGVVGDVRLDALDRAPRLETYVAFDQYPTGAMSVAVRHDPGRGAAVVAAARAAVRELDPTLPVYHVRPLEQIVAGTAGPRRLPAILFGAFGVIALLLAAVGLYGLLAFSVSQRTGEIAVRIALGAEQGSVVRQVLGEGMRLALWGALAGVALSVLVSRFMAGLLFSVRPLDASSYAIALAALGLVCAAACLAPAWRAARVDPIRALQSQ
jgi:putative ABC transport system permease protein